jgi:N6-L-threonylcarbamoyladenine synthase
MVVSGGHTNLYDCHSPVEFELLGSTTDDAAGEAFDKVAQILGLEYPGGPQIEVVARNGDPTAFPFPRTFLNDPRLDFSFSGLKTAVRYAAYGTPGARIQPPELSPQRIADLAASFQSAVIDVLVGKCEQALKQTGRTRLLVGGGVAANSLFRHELQKLADRRQIELLIAPRAYCTDNAAMGAIGWELWDRGLLSPLDVDVTPGLVRKPRS